MAPAEMNIFVARLGEEPRIYQLRRGATVKDALRTAGIEPQGADVRVDAQPSSVDEELQPNQTVTVVPKVQGGNS